eukprot:TRINITY_DN37041_c0_g1_i1.p1 TRINITY_DN37041_c0_g1~~TRINITY_DN37041_c0_g1_i1.p1  ORF type:complete len:413 (+),score=111.09 TRINITY_DN37041_c0_g1_i1:62-1300(+)
MAGRAQPLALVLVAVICALVWVTLSPSEGGLPPLSSDASTPVARHKQQPVAQSGDGEACGPEQLAWAVRGENHLKIFGDKFVPELVDALLGSLGPQLCAKRGPSVYREPVVIDVGANIGQGMPTWLHMANCSGSKVLAMEPHPRTFHVMEENVKTMAKERDLTMDMFELVRAAAGANDEQGSIYENFGATRTKAKGGGGSTMKQRAWSEAGSTYAALHQTHAYKTRKVDIDIRRVDGVIKKRLGDRRILLLKFDCEGHDESALKGATGILSQVDMIVYEYNSLWKHVNNTMMGARNLLDKHGFASMLLGGKVMTLDPPTNSAKEFNLYPTQQLTGFAVRRGSDTACHLKPFILDRAVNPACARLLTDALGCSDPSIGDRPLVMAEAARFDYSSNYALHSGRKSKSVNRPKKR